MVNSDEPKARLLWETIINSGNPFIELRKHAKEIDGDFLDIAKSEAYHHPGIFIFTELAAEANSILSELNYARQSVNTANSYHQKGNYKKALIDYKGAIQVFEKWRCSKEIGMCIMNIGIVYGKMEDFDAALQCLEWVKRDFERQNLDIEAMQCQVKIAEIHVERREYQKALEIYKKAEEFFFFNNLTEKSMACGSRINILLQISAAEDNYDTTLKMLRDTKIDTDVMKRRFLQLYEGRERKKIEKFFEDIKKRKFKPYDRYPSEVRLKLNEPYTYNIPSESIWPLIPLYGTTIIKLYPIKEKEKFERYHGFSIEDIPRLIKFAKDTNRVQFTLADAPTKFEGISFLEQIFNELEPPATAFIPLDINENDIEEFLNFSYKYRFLEFCQFFPEKK